MPLSVPFSISSYFPCLSLSFTPPPFLQHHHYLHPIFPEGRIKRWGSCVSVCVCHMCECKVVVRRGRRRVGGGGGGSCISHFPAVPLSHNCPSTQTPTLYTPYTSPSPHPILLSSSVLCCSPLLLTSALTLGSGSK